MLFPADRLDVAFKNVQRMSRPGCATVLVLVGIDTDAVCATCVLTDLLRRHDVLYELRAVQTLADLDDAFASTVSAPGSAITSVFLVNCGGRVALESRLDLRPGVYVYLVDSHRPIHHKNLAAENKQIVVFGGEIRALDKVPGPDEDEDDLVLESSDSEEESESESGEGGGGGRDEEEEEERKSASSSSSSGDRAALGADATSPARSVSAAADASPSREAEASPSRDAETSPSRGAAEPPTRKRPSPSGSPSGTAVDAAVGAEPIAKRRTATSDRRERRRRLREYYAGSYRGDPAAYTSLAMARQLQRETNSVLWWAIVGATWLFVGADAMSLDEYCRYVSEFRDAVLDLNRASVPGDASASPSAAREGVRIEFVESELRLMHLRHWSLTESFVHTEDVAGSLRCWESDGGAALNKLLARLGVSLRTAEEQHAYMSPHIRARLTGQLRELSEEFGLGDITIPSFVKRDGFEPAFSASDYAFAVAALLDGSGRSDAAAATAAVASSSTKQTRFNNAYLALTGGGALSRASPSPSSAPPNAKALLHLGVELSKEIQSVVVNKGTSLLAARSVMSAGDFRYVVVESGSLENGLAASLFARPAGVVRLALLLVRAQRAARKWVDKSAKPLVVAVRSGARAVVAGVPCPPPGQVFINGFASQFRLAAQNIGSGASTGEFFDGAVVALDVDRISIFLHALGEVMSS